MNRCTTSLFTSVCLALAACLMAAPAAAQTTTVDLTNPANVPKPNIRQFPPTAVRGELVIYMAPEATMDGKVDRLSPAVRIRDINNNLVLSGTLAKQTLVVNYVRDNIGLVQQVWILNSEEVKQKVAGQQDNGILTNIRTMFDTPTAVDDGKTPYNQLPGYKP